MWSAGSRSSAPGCWRALQLRPERRVDGARALEPLHFLEGVDALDEVVAEGRGERGHDVVQRCEPMCKLGHPRARRSDGEVRRSERRGQLAADRVEARAGQGREAHTQRPGLPRAERHTGAARKATVEADLAGADHLDANAPGSRWLERRGEFQGRTHDRCADERSAKAWPDPDGYVVRPGGQPGDVERPRAGELDLEEEAAVAADARAGHGRRAAHQPHACPRAAGLMWPTKSTWWRYVVAPGAFSVRVAAAAPAEEGQTSRIKARGRAGRTAETLDARSETPARWKPQRSARPR